jgi:hypothetical protein
VAAFSPLAGAIAGWRCLDDEPTLRQALAGLLKYLRDGVGAEAWQQLLGALEPNVCRKLEVMV